jgi:PIN domain nuclease of toxin-antitoxin system
MNLVLLDTHVWVWLMNGDSRIGSQARASIEQSLSNGAVLLSAISPWEVAMLVSKGRLTLDRDVGEWIQAAVSLPGIRLEPISPDISVASTRLPGNMHADPADRLIVATARHHGAQLMTEDGLLLDYGAEGHARVIRATK